MGEEIFTAAMVTRKAALLEQPLTSSSSFMIFLTRETTVRQRVTDEREAKLANSSRGRAEWPVTSSEGGIADVLYGITRTGGSGRICAII